MTIEDRIMEMQPAFEAAAQSIAHQLDLSDYAEFRLAPGDATVYPFIVLAHNRTVRGSQECATRKDYLVILAMSGGYGGTYEWSGQKVHWHYCASKWTRNDNEWTGRVVAALLNALSPLVPHVGAIGKEASDG